MSKSKSNRIFSTPSDYAKEHFFYVQEVGSLESIEPHISRKRNLDSYLFFIVTSGKGTLSCHDQLFPLKAGDCVWLDCQKPYYHESSKDDRWTLMWVHFNGNQAGALYQHFQEQGKHFIFHPADPTGFTASLESLYTAQKEETALTELLSNKYITDIITYSFLENKQDYLGQNSIKDKLMQIRSYIELHAAEAITLELLSEQFFISKFHLSREYKKAFGITIGNSITLKRMAQAKSELRFSNKTVESIAAACGFLDTAYFIKVFKKKEGLTPLEYRKKW